MRALDARIYAECKECGRARREADRRPPSPRPLGPQPRVREGLRAGGRLAVGNVDHHIPYSRYVSYFARIRGEPRVWVLLSSGWDHRFAAYVLDCLGRRTEAFESTNAAAYLHDFSRSPTGSPGCVTGCG